jgi:hypothetical protein
LATHLVSWKGRKGCQQLKDARDIYVEYGILYLFSVFRESALKAWHPSKGQLAKQISKLGNPLRKDNIKITEVYFVKKLKGMPTSEGYQRSRCTLISASLFDY